MLSNNILVKENLTYKEALKIIESKIRPYAIINQNSEGKHFFTKKGEFAVLFNNNSLIISDRLMNYYANKDNKWSVITFNDKDIIKLKELNLY